MSAPRESRVSYHRSVRVLWFCVGWVNVGIGGVGVVAPGLPTTIFFIFAAYSFSRSSPRFETWILSLPKIGPMVDDYRNGLGMPLRAKQLAVGSILVFSSVSVVLVRSNPWIMVGIVSLALCGIAYIVMRVPLRERVLRERAVRRGVLSGGPRRLP